MKLDYIYKISDPEYGGQSCTPSRTICLYTVAEYKTVYLWQSDKSIENILHQIKEHRNEFLPDMNCEVSYSEQNIKTLSI